MKNYQVLIAGEHVCYIMLTEAEARGILMLADCCDRFDVIDIKLVECK